MPSAFGRDPRVDRYSTLEMLGLAQISALERKVHCEVFNRLRETKMAAHARNIHLELSCGLTRMVSDRAMVA